MGRKYRDHFGVGLMPKDGAPGTAGPVPYPVGLYSSEIDYVRTQKVAPFVMASDGKYYLLEKFGVTKGVNPVTDNTGTWGQFEFLQYVFSEIIMANFAKLASAVFSGDVMMSQYGQDEAGAFSTAYQNYPTHFTPNILIDFLNGIMEFGKNIKIGVKNGYGILEYYDNDGTFLYDLGPNGITQVEVREQSWTPITNLTYLAAMPGNIVASFNKLLIKNTKNATPATIYRYTSKVVAGVNQDAVNDGLLFTSTALTNGKPLEANKLTGVYTTIRTINLQYLADGTGEAKDLPRMHPANEKVWYGSDIYFAPVDFYSGGQLFSPSSYRYYWNSSELPPAEL